MTTPLKTEYDMREVAAHKFWQDARPGDMFRHAAEPGVFTFVSHLASYHMRGTMWLPMEVAGGGMYTMEIDDRVTWYQQVPWEGMDD